MNFMKDNIIIDTNIWIYIYSKKPTEKYKKGIELVKANSNNIILSNQILGELYHVLNRKRLTVNSISQQIIEELVDTFIILENTTLQVLNAIKLNNVYNYSYWDSLIIATAIDNNCSILYTEDMHHKQLIDNKLTIINPFI